MSNEKTALEPTIEVGFTPSKHTYELKGGVKLVIDQDTDGSLSFEFQSHRKLLGNTNQLDFPLMPEFPDERKEILALGFNLPSKYEVSK